MKVATLILEPGRAEEHYWRDVWRYRELFLILAWRDVAVRYKQTLIGVAWAVLRPFLTMLIFTVVFGKLAKLPSDGQAPYALMVFAGDAPVVPLFVCLVRRGRKHSREFEFDRQGLFPTNYCSNGGHRNGVD